MHNAFTSLTGMSLVQTLGSVHGTPIGGHEIRKLAFTYKATHILSTAWT